MYKTYWWNNDVNAKVIQITATDKDTGKEGRFHIRKFYQLIIIAKDNGTIPKQQSSSCTVNITALDLNDNSPKFIGNSKLAIWEDQPPGFLIGHLKAVDIDEGYNNRVVFYLLQDHNESFFNLSTNGSLKNAKEFDRENTDRYCLQIEITDQGEPHRSVANTVCINIMDLNDNAPRLFSWLWPKNTHG